MAGNTCNHVVAIDYHLMCSHFFDFVCLFRAGSILYVNTLDLTVAEAPLIPGQILGKSDSASTA